MIHRRATLSLVLLPWLALAEAEPLAEAIRAQIGDAEPEEGGIALRTPTIAENGGQVPLTVLVDSPQTAAEHVTAIHVFATRNPTPGVATFRLTPLLARAEVQTRIRLAEHQAIIVLAQMNDGTVRRATAEIRVTTGGCLS
ncbi:thiosulfate oxidation carrier protein SoxY [Humitalea sp. 24SJ18S-53]|uniref:thiosulfate oxidation carrier protein SoxY n=1 Tax=Humitalea sp. 24SJ18S-53 TaxID=3422307 RepID=UPI003D67DA2C